MTPLLAIVLLVRIAMFPDMPAIQAMRYETEAECIEAGQQLRRTTTMVLILSCDIDI